MTETIRAIVVTGLMGAGKTTVGQRLATVLGWDWRDSDLDIEKATARTVRELRNEDGVEAMHAREAAQLLDALSHLVHGGRRLVESAAASVIDDPECRAAMTQAHVAVVWLHAAAPVLASRFDSSDAHRPAYGDDPAAFLAAQADRREPLARALGAIVIDTDGLEPDAVVGEVLTALRLTGRGP